MQGRRLAFTGTRRAEWEEFPLPAQLEPHQVLVQTLGVGPGWFISIEGGLPITVEGQCIGAIGVSGAPSAVDRQIGQAGIDAFARA